MLKNYFKIAWRNLIRYKSFSLINILGLALGMASSILIALWVVDERSVDNFHENGDRVFSLYEVQYIDDNIQSGYYTPGVLAWELKKVIPEIECASGFAWEKENPGKRTFEAESKIMKFAGCYADSDYFKMFSYPLVKGDAQAALSSPVSVSISRKMANAFFGSAEAAMGKTIRYQNNKDLTVTAVFEDLPKNTAAKFEFLLNWSVFLEENSWAKEWGNNGPGTIVMLRQDADTKQVQAKVKSFLDGYNKQLNENFRIEMGMQSIKDVYLNSNFKEGVITGGRIVYVKLFSIVAVFILLIACINFMNLATARSARRAKEIGVRKVAGAERTMLIKQFLSEAILLTAFSALVSLVIVFLSLPFFNQLTDKQIDFPVANTYFWAALTALTFVTGFVSGIYPAVIISSFKPIIVLKGKLQLSSNSVYLRKGLVVFQFVLSVGLITGTIVVSQQINFIQNSNLGYDRSNLLYIPVEGNLRTKYSVFKEEALKQAGIKSISRTGEQPTSFGSTTSGVEWEGKTPGTQPEFTNTFAGYDFVKTMDTRLVAGREFSNDFPSDSNGYIINEAALKIIKYKEPVGKPITFWERKGTIIGVVKDFHFASLHEPIRPLILRLGDDATWGDILVRTEPGKTKEAVASLGKLYKKVNPQFPFTFSFADEEYNRLYNNEQVISKLSSYFAFLGIFISCLGLLGLAMFTAEQRRKEIGIRKVLGATVASLLGLLSKEFLQLVILAMLIAIPLAWWAMNNWLQGFAYRVNMSWWIFGFAGTLSLLIAFATISFQVIKATITNPIKSLRTE